MMWSIQEPIYSFIAINHQMLNYYKLFNFGYLEHPHSTITNLTMVCWIGFFLLHQCLVCCTNVKLICCHYFNSGSFVSIAQHCNLFALSFDVHCSITWTLSTIASHINLCPSTSFTTFNKSIACTNFGHTKVLLHTTTFLHCLDCCLNFIYHHLQSSFATSIKSIVHTNLMNVNALWNLIVSLQLYETFF